MKIIGLEVANVKHLKVVNIKPDGSMVVIGGDNSAGKSCVLDSIEYALSGAGSIPTKPIRAGQKKARVVLDLGDIQVTRTFTEKGTNLTVKNKDDSTFASPQAMLDKLVGELTFDPLEFSKMDAKKQGEVLKKLVGLNFDKVDAEHKKLFTKRTEINRQGKSLKTQFDTLVKHEGVPNEEVSVAKLSAEFTKASAINRDHETKKQRITSNKNLVVDKMDQITRLKDAIAELKKIVKSDESTLSELIDTTTIQEQIDTAEQTNIKVRENQKKALLKEEIDPLRIESQSLTRRMADIETGKEKALAKAKFPIEGLAFDDDEVMFENIPFNQCSSAQQIRISVAMGLAINPKLRVLLIREGSLLDEKNLAMVAKMADKADAQIWLERVSKGKECQVIIENGEVLEPEVSNV